MTKVLIPILLFTVFLCSKIDLFAQNMKENSSFPRHTLYNIDTNSIDIGYGTLLSMTVSRDGKLLASGGGSGTVYLWDIEKKEVINSFKCNGELITTLAFSNDHLFLAAGNVNGMIRVWNTETIELIHEFKGHDYGINTLNFSPDNKLLLSGSYDAYLKLWDIAEEKSLKEYKYEDEVFSAEFSPDGNSVVCVNMNCPVLFEIHIIKNVLAANAKVTYIPTAWTNKIKFTPDGQYIIAIGSQNGNRKGSIGIWRFDDGSLVDTLTGSVSNLWGLDIAQDGSCFITGGIGNSAAFEIWDINTRKIIKTISGLRECPEKVFFSPDKKRVYSFGDTRNAEINIYDIDKSIKIDSLFGHTTNILALDISPDNKTVACGYYDGTLRLWDVESKKCLNQCVGHTNDIEYVSYFPDGSRIATLGNDANLRIWNSQTGELINFYKAYPTCMAMSHDGKYIAMGHRSGTIMLYDAAINQVIDFKIAGSGYVWDVAYSKDGSKIAYINNKLFIWDLISNKLTDSLDMYPLGTLAFHPGDNELAFTGSGRIYFWNPEKRQITDSILTKGILSLKFNNDGSMLLCGADTNIYVYDYKSRRLINTIQTNGRAVSVSRDNKYVVSGGAYGYSRVMATKEVLIEDIKEFGSEQIDRITISPNPASDYINLFQVLESIVPEGQIKIYNTFGECVITLETGLRPVSTKIDVSGLPAGVYFVRCGGQTGRFVKM